MRNPFQTSSEKLPPSDPHDELVRTVDARYRGTGFYAGRRD